MILNSTKSDFEWTITFYSFVQVMNDYHFFSQILTYFDYVFTTIFAFEVVVKVSQTFFILSVQRIVHNVITRTYKSTF